MVHAILTPKIDKYLPPAEEGLRQESFHLDAGTQPLKGQWKTLSPPNKQFSGDSLESSLLQSSEGTEAVDNSFS